MGCCFPHDPLLDWFGWSAYTDHVLRKVTKDATASAHDNAITNRDARSDVDICCQPVAAANTDGTWLKWKSWVRVIVGSAAQVGVL